MMMKFLADLASAYVNRHLLKSITFDHQDCRIRRLEILSSLLKKQALILTITLVFIVIMIYLMISIDQVLKNRGLKLIFYKKMVRLQSCQYFLHLLKV